MTNLIPLAYLNEACFLSTDIDEKKFQMVLKLAQEDLYDLIGGEFYEEIESQYAASTLTTDNSTLYETYIKDYLAWTTYGHYMKFAQADSTPTGLRQHSEDNSTILSGLSLYSFEKNVMNTAKKYADRMVNYLNLSQSRLSTAYPLWTSRCHGTFGFGISSIRRGDYTDQVITINKTTRGNE